MDQQNQTPAKTSFGITGILVKLLPILVIVFLALGVLAFVYYSISGIVSAARADDFGWFLDGVVSGIQRLGFNLFAAAVLAGISKRIEKN
ncbi:MAG: hypothetical protein E7680_05170 [Ruminococcaceae bacterium]|nr:hypothetical protein [Oscillospiraceae bacterium]